jgi:predicted dehydrogenase
MQKKIRCAIVGIGTRGMTSYAIPIANGHLSDRVKLVGLYDAVTERARLASLELGGAPVYTDFELMLTDSRPDVVVISTKDSEHEGYIIKSLELGCNVITEKPMTTSIESARRIIEAKKKSKAWVRVVFNMRYMKPMCDLKSIVLSV